MIYKFDIIFSFWTILVERSPSNLETLAQFYWFSRISTESMALEFTKERLSGKYCCL